MRRSGWTKWLIVIPAMLGIVLVTYVRYTTDIWGFGAFICQLIAILELAYGLRIAMLAQNRKKSYRLTPEDDMSMHGIYMRSNITVTLL